MELAGKGLFLRGNKTLTAVDHEKLKRIQRLATLLDSAFQIPGTSFRVGIDGLIGLLPGAGDTLTSLLSAYIVYEAARLGIPKLLLLRMVGNLVLDLGVGAIPILGDIFDIAFKANRRNLKLLNKHFGTVDEIKM